MYVHARVHDPRRHSTHPRSRDWRVPDASTILLNASEEGSSKLSDAISDTQELMCAFGIAAAVYVALRL